MKRRIYKCMLMFFMLVFVMMINVPAYAKSSKKSKVVMPKKVKEQSVDEDGEIIPYSSMNYTISYDKNGRIKKISSVSSATDGKCTYTISYKKSGKNTKATVLYEPDWGDDSLIYTYTFNSKGRLVSNHKSSEWEWDYTDESKEISFMYALDSYLVYFNKDAKFDIYYQLEGDKAKSLILYKYKTNKVDTKMSFYFDQAVGLDSVTQEFLTGIDGWSSKYEVKNSKISMTEAVKWMNTVFLLDFVY